MPSPTRPSVLPIWTQGNTPQRTQPSNGEQFAGFSPNQRPSPFWHNWLWGIMSDWFAWLDFITNTPVNFPISNSGHTVATATNLQNQLDELDAFLTALTLKNEVPTGNVDGVNTTFFLSAVPINTGSVVVMVGGIAVLPSLYTVSFVSSQWAVVFNSGQQPSLSQPIAVIYMVA